jgi:hypothetical protein
MKGKPIKIRKYTWVHPTAGKSTKFSRTSRFLCVSNPYRDKKALEEQKKYWKSRHGIEIKGDYLVDCLITNREEEKDDEDGKAVSMYKEHPYIFPLEVLKANKNQTGYKIIQK